MFNEYKNKIYAIYFANMQNVYTFDMQLNRKYKNDEYSEIESQNVNGCS